MMYNTKNIEESIQNDENKITEENPAIIYEKNGVYVEIPLIMTLQK